MKPVGIIGRFAEEDELLALQDRCLQTGLVSQHPLAMPYLNIAGWLLPPSAVPVDIFKDIPPELPQMEFQFQAHIDLHRSVPLLGIEACVNHIINEWHFRIHKSFELPYLAAHANDVPERWRPRIYFGRALSIDMHNITFPASLRCTSLALYDRDNDVFIAEHQLNPTDAIPW